MSEEHATLLEAFPTRGWRPDPYGRAEDRWFAFGRPTPLVRRGGVESYDRPGMRPEPTPPVRRAVGVPEPAYPGARPAASVRTVRPADNHVPPPTPHAPPDELHELVEQLMTLDATAEENRPQEAPAARRTGAQIALLTIGDLALSLPLTASLGGFAGAGAFTRTAPVVAASLAIVYGLAYRMVAVMAARSRRADGMSPEGASRRVASPEDTDLETPRQRVPVV